MRVFARFVCHGICMARKGSGSSHFSSFLLLVQNVNNSVLLITFRRVCVCSVQYFAHNPFHINASESESRRVLSLAPFPLPLFVCVLSSPVPLAPHFPLRCNVVFAIQLSLCGRSLPDTLSSRNLTEQIGNLTRRVADDKKKRSAEARNVKESSGRQNLRAHRRKIIDQKQFKKQFRSAFTGGQRERRGWFAFRHSF